MREIKLQDLKSKTPTELITFAEELEVENASTMRKQELMFAILKQLAAREVEIIGAGVVSNTPENLHAWLRDPHSVKPGVLMPGYQDMPEEDMQALVEYLGGLK